MLATVGALMFMLRRKPSATRYSSLSSTQPRRASLPSRAAETLRLMSSIRLSP